MPNGADMASALLIGPGSAVAIDLDGTGENAPTAVKIATQTISLTDTTTVAQVRYHNINIGDVDFEITPNVFLESDDGYFVRIALGGGMIFRDTLAAPTAGTVAMTPIQGGSGHSQAVYRLADDLALAADPASPNKITLSVDENLAVTNNMPGNYTASMTLHTAQFDAIDGVGALRNVGAENVVVVSAVSGIDSRITPTNHVADVGTGFRWFVGPDADMPNTSKVEFGTANAMAVTTGNVLDAGGGLEESDQAGAGDHGTMATDADLINATGVTIGIEGDFSVGVFDLIATMHDADDDPATEDVAQPCPTHTGSADSPVMADAGNLKPNEDDPTMRMRSGLPAGAYKLCMEVDLAGERSNTSPIPATDYIATVYTRNTTDRRDNMMANESSIGKITRNGASVEIGYLTVSEKHNQRLVIVNRGSRPVSILDIDFQSEPGIEVELSAAAQALQGTAAAMIMPNDMGGVHGQRYAEHNGHECTGARGQAHSRNSQLQCHSG